MEAMKTIFPALPAHFGIPIVMVQHVSPLSDSQWISLLNQNCRLELREANEKEEITPGNIYLAPPNYHLLVERNHSFSLTIDARVNYARPAIDVLFETAAVAYEEELVGVVLTGSNHDGAQGLKKIKGNGGLTIVQDPKTAASAFMPQAAIDTVAPDHVLPLEKIIELLIELDRKTI